jgi:predicted ATPase
MQLQISAQPDTVAIERTTRDLIGDLFDCRGLDAIETAGGSEPMRRWQVLGERAVESRFEALRGSGLSPLIGRDEEIDLLRRRWERAKTGDGQIVLFSGEAGIGKSRIVTALAERLDAEAYLRLRYFCSPHHQDSALFPFVDQLGRAAEFARDDPPETRLEKLDAVIARAVPPDEDVGLLADLLALPASERYPLPNLSPQRKKEKTLDALIRQLQGLARRQPVMAVFEDAHWLDPTSRELLDLTVERVRALPVLLIVTFRPEFQPPWTGQPHVTLLTLNRLDRGERVALVTQIAGGKALPDSVIDQIVDRTDGVPLFVEELTKSVLESGLLREKRDRYVLDHTLPALAIPATLHASLMARLDRSPSLRRVAQIGAAIGRDFSYALLRAVSHTAEDELETSLSALVASELVLQRGTPPDAVYRFKHALVQDAAHGSLLRASRRQLHAQIAAALEAQSPELMESEPELFARHYTEAGLIDKSVTFWGKAGQRSADRSAMTEAAAQYQKGLDQLALLPDSPERQRQELELRSSLGVVLRLVKGYASPETGRALDSARVLWEELGAPPEFLNIPFWQSLHHHTRGELDLAGRLDDRLLRLSHRRNDSAGLVLGHLSCGRTLMLSGSFASSRSHLEAALALYDPTSHSALVNQIGMHPHVNVLAFLGIVLFCLGYPEQALAQSNAAIAEARRLGHPPSLAAGLTNGCVVLSLVGDTPALDLRAQELAALAAEQSFPSYRSHTALYQGWVRVKDGDPTEGISLLQSGAAAYRASGMEAWVPFASAYLAEASETVGRENEALKLLQDASEMTERTGARWFAAELNRRKGQLLLRQGDLKAAEQLYLKALGVAREQKARLWELRVAVSLARLRRDQGCLGEARELLAPVHGWFTEGFGTPDLKEAKVLLDELL